MTPTAWLLAQLQHNQFLAAALVAAPVSVLTYAVRQYPFRAWLALKRQCSISITFNSDVPDYLIIQQFVSKRVACDRFTRSYVYGAERAWDQAAGEHKVQHHGLTPGYGSHLGWWRGRPVFICREMKESNASAAFKEQLTLTFLTRKRERVRDFVLEVRDHVDRGQDHDHISMFINSGGWWRAVNRLPKRALDTVFTPAEAGRQLIEHVRTFEARRDWYRERGLPWHTGILLTGPPGTGKTSLVHALASELGRSLYYLNLGSIESDEHLSTLVAASREWCRALLVIEDADAGGLNVSRQAQPGLSGDGDAPVERQPVTLSALLNVLDGLLTPDGLVVVASSNHPEKLDAALLRPGRFDLKLELGDLDWLSFARMARLFGHDLSDDDPRRSLYRPAPGAELRAQLLEGDLTAILRPVAKVAAA